MRGVAVAHPEKALKQADELPVKVWRQYSIMAAEGRGAIRLVASTTLYIATIALRFKHTQRHTFLHGECRARTLIGLVSKGKTNGGAAFKVA